MPSERAVHKRGRPDYRQWWCGWVGVDATAAKGEYLTIYAGNGVRICTLGKK